jgi:hypothetical protein
MEERHHDMEERHHDVEERRNDVSLQQDVVFFVQHDVEPKQHVVSREQDDISRRDGARGSAPCYGGARLERARVACDAHFPVWADVFVGDDDVHGG